MISNPIRRKRLQRFRTRPILIVGLVLLFSFPLASSSQTRRDSIAFYGKVMDSFTYEMLKGVHVEVLRMDSTLIVDFETNNASSAYGYPHNVFGVVTEAGYMQIPRQDCIFRFSKDGYMTSCLDIKKSEMHRRETRFFIGEVLLKKQGLNSQELGEAVVTTSKIRMIVKGDTLVYNADAFQLSEGSMLDGLIKLLPGFELNDGQIFVNGQYVSSLLVNGENFFRGDPRVALENLPSYMVERVKVYRKKNDYNYIVKERNKEKLPLVVDVNLKREYSIGWVANIAAGYGLEDRYFGRLFGLRFTNNSRLAIYGNTNNTNDTREPGTSDDWNAHGAVSGRTKMQTGGLEVLVKDKNGVWKYTGNAKLFHQETDDQSASSSEFFNADMGGSYLRSRSQREDRSFKAQTSHQYDYRKQGGYVTVRIDGAYQHRRNVTDILSAEFSSDPQDNYRSASLDSLFFSTSDRLVAMLVNRNRNRVKGKTDMWQASAVMKSFIKVPHTPDFIAISASTNIEKKKETSFSDYELSYGANAGEAATSDNRSRYAPTSSLSANADIGIDYAYRPEWATITPYYKFSLKYDETERTHYRLDLLADDAPAFGALPSTVSALMRSLDAPNSYDSHSRTITQRTGVDLCIWLPGNLPSHNVDLKPEVQWREDHLSYQRSTYYAKPRRTEVAFTPTVSWGFDNCLVTYRFCYDYPELVSQLNFTDDVDPLNVYKGNPDLKRSTTHSVSVNRSFSNWQTGWQLGLNASWQVTRNAIAHSVNYDAQTGVRTYSPQNVNGNWSASFSTDYKQPLGEKKQTIVFSTTAVNYRNSVDYVAERHSSVRNLRITETLHLNTRLKQCVLDFSVAAQNVRAISSQGAFEHINSYDFKYSVVAQIPLLAKIDLSTGLTLYHRTGYTDASMNEVRFVANARLSRSFFKGLLVMTIDGFDIFHGLSKITKTLNAQGVTETWHNSLPSYAMFGLTYKFNKAPKKR